MTTKFTPAQVRFFLNASIKDESQEQQPTLLNRLLGYKIPLDLRYRLEVLQRQLESMMKPVEVEIRDLYAAFQAAVPEKEKKEDEAAEPDDEEDAAAATAKAEAEKKFRADIEEIDNKPVEFTGKLILATQLVDPKMPPEADAFLSIPGIMRDWLAPFTIDNLPEK